MDNELRELIGTLLPVGVVGQQEVSQGMPGEWSEARILLTDNRLISGCVRYTLMGIVVTLLDEDDKRVVFDFFPYHAVKQIQGQK